MYKYSQNFVRPQGRWGGGTFGRKVQRWLGGSEGEWAVCKPLVGGSFKNKPNMGGREKLSECLLLGWKIFNLVLKVVKPKILYVFAPEGRVPYLVFWEQGFPTRGGGQWGGTTKSAHYFWLFFKTAPLPHLGF